MTNLLGLAGFVILIAVGLMGLGCALFGFMSADHVGSLTRVLGGLGGYFAAWAAAIAIASRS